MRWKEKKGKGAGTDSTQLFSIKPFMASIKFSVSVWEVPLDCCCTPCSGLRGRRVFDSTTIQTGREQIRLVFSCQSPAFKLIEEDKKKRQMWQKYRMSVSEISERSDTRMLFFNLVSVHIRTVMFCPSEEWIWAVGFVCFLLQEDMVGSCKWGHLETLRAKTMLLVQELDRKMMWKGKGPIWGPCGTSFSAEFMNIWCYLIFE